MTLRRLLARALRELAVSCESYDIHAACVLRLLSSSVSLGTSRRFAQACIEHAARETERLDREIKRSLADFAATKAGPKIHTPSSN